MADASCSGTTPYKRLIDHQTRDVSHHQDRLVDNAASRGHGSFRSARQQGQGQEGFGAFMDGSSALPGMAHDPAGRLAVHAAALEHAHAPAFHQARASPAPDVRNWAADFSRLSNQQQQPRAPIQNGFSQPTQMNGMHMNQPASHINFQSAFAQPGAGFAPLYGPTNSGFMDPSAAAAQRPAAESDFDQEMSRWMDSHGNARSMENVDAVMDQMARELELNEAALAAPPVAHEAHFTDLETPEIGNLSLESRNAPQSPLEQVDDAQGKSAVSEAAERLLESVQHEDGEKWKNSVFLSLMRDFRDGRKDIVDNEIRQTGDEGGEVAN